MTPTRRSLFRLFAVAPFVAPAIADTLISVATYKQVGGRLLSAKEFFEILSHIQNLTFEANRQTFSCTYERFTDTPIHFEAQEEIE